MSADVFLGEYQHSLDDKGRVVLPSKFRDDLAKGCYVTKGQDRCVYVFPESVWQREVQRVMDLPVTNRVARAYSRTFFGGASDQRLDRQGRIAISPQLREYASLDKDVTIVGVAERVEIWSTPAWEELSAQADDIYAEIENTLHREDGI